MRICVCECVRMGKSMFKASLIGFDMRLAGTQFAFAADTPAIGVVHLNEAGTLMNVFNEF